MKHDQWSFSKKLNSMCYVIYDTNKNLLFAFYRSILSGLCKESCLYDGMMFLSRKS